MNEIAERIEEVRVVVGVEAFGALLPAGLLARSDKADSSRVNPAVGLREHRRVNFAAHVEPNYLNRQEALPC